MECRPGALGAWQGAGTARPPSRGVPRVLRDGEQPAAVSGEYERFDVAKG